MAGTATWGASGRLGEVSLVLVRAEEKTGAGPEVERVASGLSVPRVAGGCAVTGFRARHIVHMRRSQQYAIQARAQVVKISILAT